MNETTDKRAEDGFLDFVVNMCKLKCVARSSCVNVGYQSLSLVCYTLKKQLDETAECGRFTLIPKRNTNVRAGSCAFRTCQGSRCLQTGPGKAACVKDAHDQAQNQTIVNITLIDACLHGDLRQVKYILSQGRANINTRGQNGTTPVMIAAVKGHREMFELLVKKGSDLSLLDDDDNNILHLACREGNVEIVKYIHSQKIIDIESRGAFEETPLMFAAEFGKGEVFSYLMEVGANIYKVDRDSENILHLSCKGGNVEIVDYVLKQNVIDLNSREKKGMTPLLLSAYFGERDVFDLLIGRGADTSSVNDFGENILHFSCRGGNVDIVKYVLKQNVVDIESRDNVGMTPVLLAAFWGKRDAFDLLIGRGADPTVVDENGDNILHHSCRGGNVDIVKSVLKQNVVDINSRGNGGMTPVLMAAVFAKRDVFDLLIGRGADTTGVDEDGENILHLSCKGGNLEIVKYILKQDIVDINSDRTDGMTPLLLSAYLGERDVFDLLIGRGADISSVNDFGENILHFSCRGENVDIVKYVLKQNVVDINSRDNEGMTPVLLAAFWGERDAFDLLIGRGADTTVVNENGDNILHLSCKGGNLEIVKYVLKQDIVDIESRDNEGMTPVLLAAFWGERDAFDFLIGRGADTSRVDDHGDNILHLSCRGGNVDIVKYVLRQKIVDINIEGRDGKTPVMLAATNEKQDVFNLLLSEGADVSKLDGNENGF
ncbi:putative ankyrin repeat protein RF_0381 [Haliotis rufescens]|uniref:putative ankyrin repeat protein RF_0381 n=1 Tax=Haliotis rufescens TaxID=6454 RepID=UPI00201E7703|nr:putative ankyrin repeat protein RF_0381 [Haliotis rufescens]